MYQEFFVLLKQYVSLKTAIVSGGSYLNLMHNILLCFSSCRRSQQRLEQGLSERGKEHHGALGDAEGTGSRGQQFP